MLPGCPGKEPLGGRHVTSFAQEKIDGAARFIHCAIKVNPLAFDLNIDSYVLDRKHNQFRI
jgi:hypothetical protein